MKTKDPKEMYWVQFTVLVLLTFQCTSAFLLTRYSRGILGEDYILSTSVFFIEVTKFLVSIYLIYREKRAESKTKEEIRKHYFELLKTCYVLIPPAFMYFLQNSLAYVSLQNIRAVYFSVINQLKMLTTAIFTVIFLKRTISGKKWVAIGCLIVGVVLVKWRGSSDDDETESNFIGLITAIIITILSGASGVYIEFFLKMKNSKLTIWDRNFQLSLPSMVFAILSAFLFDGNRIFDEGFFTGYSIYAVGIILVQSCGGIIVAMVIKYANNVIKGFAVSCAIVLATIFSFLFWDFPINLQFIIGVVIVIGAMFLYMDLGNFGKKKKEVVQEQSKLNEVVVEEVKEQKDDIIKGNKVEVDSEV